MKTNPDHALDALLAAARGTAGDTGRVEFGFETRLLARLREEQGAGIFAWAWRLAPFFAALVIAAGLWGGAPSARVESAARLMADAARHGDQAVWLVLGQR